MREYPHLFDYDQNINLKLLDFAAAENITGRAIEIFAHIASALAVWHKRAAGDSTKVAIWPDQDLVQTRKDFLRVYSDWSRLLVEVSENDLERSVIYTNSKGERYGSTLREILDHLLLHGAYHRGQINLLLRQSGTEPLATDYIFFQRKTSEL
ncbi:MAG: DinB family protein [Bacteroidia bacterium]